MSVPSDHAATVLEAALSSVLHDHPGVPAATYCLRCKADAALVSLTEERKQLEEERDKAREAESKAKWRAAGAQAGRQLAEKDKAIAEEALREIAANPNLECSYAHGVDCRGLSKSKRIAREALSKFRERKNTG